MNAKEKLVACYVRVSDVSQNEGGQRAEIERWLNGNNIDPQSVRWYVDKGNSGDNLKRPSFKAMQAAIFNGEVGTVVTYKLDRLSRKLLGGLIVLADWCERGIRVVSVTQELDFNGHVGKLIASVLLCVAEMEQEVRRERQKAGIQVVLADVELRRRKYKGRRPGTFKAKPKRAQRLREKGLSLSEIATTLNVSKNTVCRYLRTVKAQPSN